MVAPFTQLSPVALPGKRYSFVAKAAASVPVVPIGGTVVRIATDADVVVRTGMFPQYDIDHRIQNAISRRVVASPTGDYLLTLEDYDQEEGDPWQPPGGEFTWNTACWAAGLDFTGIGSWQWHEGQGDAGHWHLLTLLSPRHGAVAEHAGLAVGQLVRFVRADGTIYTAEVESTEDVGTDHEIVYFTTDVPIATISFYSVFSAEDLISVVRLPIIFFDAERKAKIAELRSIFADITLIISYTESGDYPDRADYYELQIDGDSSAPHFMLMGGNLVFLGPTASPLSHSTTSTEDQIEAINTAMASLSLAAGGDDTYQLTEGSLGTGSQIIQRISSPSDVVVRC